MKLKLLVLWATLFVIGSDGFVIAGLLQDIASHARVSVSAAGQLITVFSLVYAVFGPILASAAGNIDRKNLLITAMLVFTAGNLLIAVTSDYGVIVAGRIIAALGACLVTPTVMMIAAMLAPAERRGKYLSYVIGGITVATIVGVPLGTFAGHLLGYRSVFLAIAVGSVLIIVLQLAMFPRTPSPFNVPLAARLSVLKLQGAKRTLLITFLVFLGAFTVYSYVAVYFTGRADVSAGEIAEILLAFGIGGSIGNLFGGHLTDRWGAKKTVFVSVSGLCVSFVLISLFAREISTILALTFLWGVFGWLLAPAQQHRLVGIGKERSQLLISLNASGMYFGIGASGIVGAIVIRHLGPAALTWVAATVAVLCAVLVMTLYQDEHAARESAGTQSSS
ncbi:MFS transporter [Burkholderia metallica]|uniref:MFS transporter n=1 Tax=Burkholderia metallica TaxID=488729 RepID=UPI00157B6DDF|nr:MFS transporter [Burkholderia metallica]NTZ83022.1 MFS transporter [Burkholderia metallica]